MKDVASRAGVALKTVSRVVNGEPGVTPATASRVLGAIEDSASGATSRPGCCAPGRPRRSGSSPTTGPTRTTRPSTGGWRSVARSNGYLLYSGSTDRDRQREERLALAMCARRVDGLIIIPTPGSHDYLVSEIEAGVAAVFVLPPTDRGARLRADAVLPDERGGGRAAVAHLIAHGHRRIGLSRRPRRRPGTGSCWPATPRRWRRPG